MHRVSLKLTGIWPLVLECNQWFPTCFNTSALPFMKIWQLSNDTPISLRVLLTCLDVTGGGKRKGYCDQPLFHLWSFRPFWYFQDGHASMYTLDNLKSTVNLTPLIACFWLVEGSFSTRREPMQTWAEDANSTQNGPDQMVEWNSVLLWGTTILPLSKPVYFLFTNAPDFGFGHSLDFCYLSESL